MKDVIKKYNSRPTLVQPSTPLLQRAKAKNSLEKQKMDIAYLIDNKNAILDILKNYHELEGVKNVFKQLEELHLSDPLDEASDEFRKREQLINSINAAIIYKKIDDYERDHFFTINLPYHNFDDIYSEKALSTWRELKFTHFNLSGCYLTCIPDSVLTDPKVKNFWKNVYSIKLSNNRLTTLPKEIGQLSALTLLDLSHNELTTLPKEIGQLSALRTLVLRLNQLTTLPEEIGQLSALSYLDLGNNQLTTIPREIGQLSALTALQLGNNKLTTLPKEIGQLSALKDLSLSRNQLTTLPKEIGQLLALSYLGLRHNQLNILPKEIGQLSALTSLDLSSNQLTTLPNEIGQLSALTSLDLSYNRLTSLPKEIEQLTSLTSMDLSNNQLATLLDFRCPITLSILSLFCNPLAVLPDHIKELINLSLIYLPDDKNPISVAGDSFKLRNTLSSYNSKHAEEVEDCKLTATSNRMLVLSASKAKSDRKASSAAITDVDHGYPEGKRRTP